MVKRYRKIGIVIFIFFTIGLVLFLNQKPKTNLVDSDTLSSPTPKFSPGSLNCPDCNVILIGIDTLGVNHMSAYDYEKQTTPYLEELIKKSIKFNQHYVQIPYTPPSFWSIMTGLYPHTHNLPNPNNMFPSLEFRQQAKLIEQNLINPPDMGDVQLENIDEKIPVLPRILQTHGYKTRGQVSQVVLDSLTPVFEEFKITEETPNENRAFYQTTDQAINWLTTNKNEKFFLFIHYWDSHSPYSPTAEFDVFKPQDKQDYFQTQAAKYDGEVLFVDHKIQILMNKIQELKLDENTLVVITSDHGEQFGEKNCDDFLKENARCQGHSQSLYEEEIHTPLIIYLPKNSGGKEINSISQSIDIMPTILDIVGIPIPETEGKSLVPLVLNEQWEEQAAFSELSKFTAQADVTSIRNANWKLINIYKKDGIKQLLYDLSRGENHDFSSEKLPLVKELETLLQKITQGKKLPTIDKRDLDQNTIQLLKSLGYL